MMCYLAAAFIFFGCFGFAKAQETIFNVPSADILEKGKVYAELDASFKPNDQDALRRFSSFVPRIVVGVGHDIEVGLNVTGNIQPGSDTTTLVPTVKWRFYQSRKKDVSLIAGTDLYIPIKERTYNFGTYSYVAVSKTIGKTRLTAGGYVASKNVFAPGAVRGGGQFGLEQAVNDKLSFAADWVTGRNSSGYFSPGVIYKPIPSISTYWAYSIGNQAAVRGDHFFLFEIGYNFN